MIPMTISLRERTQREVEHVGQRTGNEEHGQLETCIPDLERVIMFRPCAAFDGKPVDNWKNGFIDLDGGV